MKKLLTLAIFLFLSGHFAFGQNAFYDAQYLATLTPKEDSLISAPLGTKASQFSDEEINTIAALKKFLANPFDNTVDRTLLNPVLIKKMVTKLNQLSQPVPAGRGAYATYGFGSDLPGGSSIASTLVGNGGVSSFNSANIQTMLIDATAKYLAKSFKEDMTYRYFVLLKQKIDESPVCQDLLPQTSGAVEKIDPFNFKNLGTSWKAAFEGDMQNLPVSFTKFIKDNPTIPWCAAIAKSPYFTYYNYSVDILNPLIKGETPVQILQTLDNNYYKANSPNVNAADSYKSFIHLVNILQSNLQDTVQSSKTKQVDQWISFSQLKQLNTPLKQEYFCALIYLQDPGFFTNDVLGKEIGSLIDQTAPATAASFRAKLVGSLSNWLTLLNQVQGGVQEIRTAKANGTTTAVTIGIYMKNVLAITDSTNSILKKLAATGSTLETLTTTINTCINYGNDADSLYNDITAKNYGGAITQITSLLTAIDKKDRINAQLIQQYITASNYVADFSKITNDFTSLNTAPVIAISVNDFKALLLDNVKFNIIDPADFAAALKAKINYSGLAAAVQTKVDKDLTMAVVNINNLNKDLANDAQIKALASYPKLLALLNKYGNVIAGVATAQNSDDLENVIENFIATSGSYVTQKTSLSTISLAAKVGLYAGGEGNDQLKSFKPSFGLSVPIGIEFTWGNRTNDKTPYPYLDNKDDQIKYLTGATHGIFVQFFDIAAVVNYRLGADSASTLPNKILLQQVFSPGLTYNIGIKNAPFDIGIGGEYTPQLRQIGQDLQASTIRVFIRISWDKPLIYIHSRSASD